MKIAFVGASGYGNIGDDTYPLVFGEHFRDCDRVVFNSNLPRSLPDDTSLVVLGGGGILFNSGECNAAGESPHFRCMRFYMEWAIQHRIPWGIISCGFQFRPREEAPPAEVMRHWTPYLKQAQFITLRSPVCARIARELTGRTDVRFFPDLAYLFRPKVPAKAPRKNILTIVPAGVMNPQNAFVQHVVRLHLSMGYQVQWLSMGSPRDDQHHLNEAAIRYSSAIWHCTSGC